MQSSWSNMGAWRKVTAKSGRSTVQMIQFSDELYVGDEGEKVSDKSKVLSLIQV